MSYCMCQNTNLALAQVLNRLEETRDEGISLKDYMKEISQDEKQALVRLLNKCQEILDIVDEMEDTEENN